MVKAHLELIGHSEDLDLLLLGEKSPRNVLELGGVRYAPHAADTDTLLRWYAKARPAVWPLRAQSQPAQVVRMAAGDLAERLTGVQAERGIKLATSPEA